MNEKTMETITVEKRAAHIIDMCHRMTSITPFGSVK